MAFEARMPEIYACYDHLDNHGDPVLYSLDVDEVIEHLRSKHKLSFIRRPNRPGDQDSHEHVWYCFDGETDTGKDHRSFQSGEAMWNHLNDRHFDQLDGIKIER